MDPAIFLELYMETYMKLLIQMFENMNLLEQTPAYVISSTVLSLGTGVLACICIIAAAFLMKKSKVLGVIAGLFQIPGAYSVQLLVNTYLQMDLFQTVTIYGSSMSDVNQKLDAFYAQYFAELIPDMICLCVCGAIMMAAWVLGLVFLIQCIRRMPKLLSIPALIAHVCRYMFAVPFNLTVMFVPLTVMGQTGANVLYYIATLLPFVLVLIGSFFSKRHLAGRAAEAQILKEAE